jgi:large subunit ribosomal protein L2
MNIPTKLFQKLSFFSDCIVGRVSNRFYRFTKNGKASIGIKKKKKVLSVRGIAMNPVDHPNGGRANTKRPLRNPWGKVAKFGK